MNNRAWLLALGLPLCCSNLLAAERPSPASLARQIKVQPDRAPDCSSLKAIVESVTCGCRTNDEKAIALYNFMQLALSRSPSRGPDRGSGAVQPRGAAVPVAGQEQGARRRR
jgi:hypothetical protein